MTRIGGLRLPAVFVAYGVLLAMASVVTGQTPNRGTETATASDRVIFPDKLCRFRPYQANPLFVGAGGAAWDAKIRERGFLLRDGDRYLLWYTGYNPARSDSKFLGLATSTDGIRFVRHPENPIFRARWTEDVFVVKQDGVFHMFAEGRNDIAHQLTSPDGVHWRDEGDLDIRLQLGTPISPGPRGTPTVFVDDGVWYLYYERNDAGVWLARSTDRRVWTNVQDRPVLKPGPEPYDRFGIAMNQVIKYQGRYYGYYHGTAHKNWSLWSTNLAVSDDKVHWTKYSGNPIVGENMSSGIVVAVGSQFRLYTMHPDVRLFLPE